MSYYVVKIYGLICDGCEAGEEHVPRVDSTHKLADLRRELAKDPQSSHGPWVYRDGKDLCAKCARENDEGAAAPEGTAAPRSSRPIVLHRVGFDLTACSSSTPV